MDPDPLVIYTRAPRWLRRREFSDFAKTLLEELAGGRRFCCRVTDDEELRQWNAVYRGKDEPTDVLSFPAAGGSYLGDLAISADRARAQAAALGHPPQTEMAILLLHGLLHLLGYDHESDRGQMRRLETRWRKRLGLPVGLIERSVQR
jgi:probable rRNA maturation factor